LSRDEWDWLAWDIFFGEEQKKEFFAQEFSEHMYFFAKSVRHIEF
jgi:hypothetical protein